MTERRISPREAVRFALDVAGVRNLAVVTELVLLALKLTGWMVVAEEGFGSREGGVSERPDSVNVPRSK